LETDLLAGCDRRIDCFADDGIGALQIRVSHRAHSLKSKSDYSRRKALEERVDARSQRLYY